MAESREELVEALERARRTERRARATMRRWMLTAETCADYREAINATYAAQDALQQWDEDHYGEES